MGLRLALVEIEPEVAGVDTSVQVLLEVGEKGVAAADEKT